MKPNVLITLDTYAIGGPGKLVLEFLDNGGRDGCNPLVAGFWRGPDRPWQFREAVESRSIPFAVLRQIFAFDPLVIGAAYRLARENNIQLLESHGYKSHVVCLALKHMLGLPWIAYVHGWTNENFKVELYNKLDRYIVRFADRIVPVSRYLGDRLNLDDRQKEKLVYIPNAVNTAVQTGRDDMARARLGLGEGELLLGVVGRLSPEKGHRYFIKALRKIIAAHPNVKAVFVGDGQERETIMAEISQNGLEDRVILAGYQTDVAPYYRACDIIVMPSLREGMPLAALEAMSYAKPVVATTVGGIPEVVIDGQTGLMVEPANPSALAGAIASLIDNPDKMTELGLAGRRRVEAEFSPLVRTERMISLYMSVIKG